MSYFNRLIDALLSRPVPLLPPHPAGAELGARIASLEMDLRERDEKIAAMRKEYAKLDAERKQAAAGGAEERLEQLFKKLCAPLSSLLALASSAASGKPVGAADMATLVHSLEKQLAAAGLERIGMVGESVQFDVALHQRMSGGTVSPGVPVTMRMPGFRFAGKVLQKAMVSSKEQPHE